MCTEFEIECETKCTKLHWIETKCEIVKLNVQTKCAPKMKLNVKLNMKCELKCALNLKLNMKLNVHWIWNWMWN